ncbi:MAG: hypothetical protein ABFD98_11660 [Syntrophobacteraceae bacterium]|nr:hypothetical protein [Desulfobacteraceae bacterium]
MKKLQAKLLIASIFLLFLSIVVFILNNVVVLSNLLAGIHPVLGRISLWLLLGLSGVCICYLAGVCLLRQKPLTLPEKPGPGEERTYLKSVLKRLQANRELRERGCRPERLEDIPEAIAVLDGIAEEEIRRTAKRVFVSSAVSQNGRLDAIIVFCQVAVLIWRVSRVYGQRPNPVDLWNVYCNVLTASMISYGIEEIDLADQVGALVSPLFANSVLDHVPVVKTFTKVFTRSILSGSANAGLVCRVGVVAKNCMGLKTVAGLSSRQRPAVEAARILNSISSESVQKVLAALGGSIAGAGARGAKMATGAVVGGMGATVRSVADVGRAVGGTALSACGSAGEGVRKAGSHAVGQWKKVSGAVRDVFTRGAKQASSALDGAKGMGRDFRKGLKELKKPGRFKR